MSPTKHFLKHIVMHTIAVVDDRSDVRDTARRRIERGLKKMNLQNEWRVLAIPPLSEVSSYPGWLIEEEVLVLILDERLNESASERVPYSGHDIVRHIRPRLFDLPIYYLTAVPHDAAVEADGPRVQGILAREPFFDDPEPWVREFVREGIRYEEQVARKLARLGEVAHLAVSGNATEEDLEEAASLRQEFQLPFESGAPDAEQETATRAELLDDFGREIYRLEQVVEDLRTLLDRSDRKESRGGTEHRSERGDV